MVPRVGRITVVVSPGARRTELAGRQGDAWKVRVAAPPERGRANAAACELLAGLLGVPRRGVTVAAGTSSRRKTILVEGLEADEIHRRLTEAR